MKQVPFLESWRDERGWALAPPYPAALNAPAHRTNGDPPPTSPPHAHFSHHDNGEQDRHNAR